MHFGTAAEITGPVYSTGAGAVQPTACAGLKFCTTDTGAASTHAENASHTSQSGRRRMSPPLYWHGVRHDCGGAEQSTIAAVAATIAKLARCAPPLEQVLRSLQEQETSTPRAGAAVLQELDRGKGRCDVNHHEAVHYHHDVLTSTWPLR